MIEVITHHLVCLAAQDLVPLAVVPDCKDETGTQQQRSYENSHRHLGCLKKFRSIAVGIDCAVCEHQLPPLTS